MTKTLSLLSLAVMSVAMGAQTTPTSPQPDPSMTPGTTQTQAPSASDTPSPAARARAAQVEAASVGAELTKSLDAKRAHVGDAVEARMTNEAKLADGTTLPRGTKLVGSVVDVTPKSKQEKNSRIVIALNRAVLKDGKQVAIQSAVTSMTAPASEANAAVVTAPSGPPAAGGGSASAPSAPSMGSVPSETAQSTPGLMLKGSGDQVPVGNKPKIMLSAPTTPDSSAVLEAQGENVSLESGTKLTLNVIPTAQA